MNRIGSVSGMTSSSRARCPSSRYVSPSGVPVTDRRKSHGSPSSHASAMRSSLRGDGRTRQRPDSHMRLSVVSIADAERMKRRVLLPGAW